MRVPLRMLVGLAALSCMLVGAGTVGVANAAPLRSITSTCSGGTIAPGTYQSLKITGNCSIPSGEVIVRGGLTIEQNAVLDAHSDAATVIISGGVVVEKNGIFALGCAPSLTCATVTNDRINGGVRADEPLELIFHGNTIRGGISLEGGGGGAKCPPPNAPPESAVFSTFEGNHISGGVSVTGYKSCWFGFIRNDVHGTVKLTDNTLADPDAMEIVTNTISGNLVCFGNSPAPQIGDSRGQLNVVTGRKVGQCTSV